MVADATDSAMAENWIFDLQELVIEEVYHAAALAIALREDHYAPFILPSTASWHGDQRWRRWEMMPGLFPPPAVSSVTLWWLSEVTFLFCTHSGTRALASRSKAFAAAERVIDQLHVQLLLAPDEFYPRGEANDSLQPSDFGP